MLQALFSSRARVKLLTHFFLHPGERFYARGLARGLNEHYNAVWEELGNLERAGLLHSEREAGVKYYRLDPEFLLYPELKSIVLETAGLGLLLREALGRLGTVEVAFVYGSVAAGREDPLSDLDLMLVGQVDLQALATLIAELEDRAGRAINYVVFTVEELGERVASGDPFIQNVLAGPKVMLIGDENSPLPSALSRRSAS